MDPADLGHHISRRFKEDLKTGGVYDHGTHEEDDPVTWEALVVPREKTGVAESR